MADLQRPAVAILFFSLAPSSGNPEPGCGDCCCIVVNGVPTGRVVFTTRPAQTGRGAAALSASLLAATIASLSSAFAQSGAIQEKSIQETFAGYSGAPAHPSSGWQVQRSLIARQPALDCEVREPESDTVDADLWVRLKLKYQRHCYKQAEALIHRRLQELSAINRSRLTSNNTRLRNLNTVGLFDRAIPDASTADRSMGVEDVVPSPSMGSPGSTGKAAETIRSEGLASSAVKDAKFYLAMGIVSYRDGDLPAAIADFALAIEFNPGLEDAYINQGVVWYRVGSSKRAFDVIAQAVRIGNAH